MATKETIVELAKKAMDILNRDQEKALELAQRSLDAAKGLDPDNPLLQAPANTVFAIHLLNAGNVLSASTMLENIVDTYVNAGIETEWLVHAYYYLGTIYARMDLYTKALDAHQHQYGIAKKMGVKLWMASALRRMGVTQVELQQYERAILYYMQAKQLFEDDGRSDGVASVYNNLAIVFEKQGDYEQALDYALKSSEGFESTNFEVGLVEANATIAVVYTAIEQYDKACIHVQKSLEIARQLDRTDRLIHPLTQQGIVQGKLGQYDVAITYLDEAYQLAEEVDNIAAQRDIFQALSEVYEGKGEYEQALIYHRHYFDTYKYIVNEQTTARFEHMETVYKTHMAVADAEFQKKRAKEIEERAAEDRRYFEELNNMKNEFINAATHDLKNPLNTIMLATQLLRMDGNEKIQFYIDQIVSESHRMRDLIAEILDLAKLETGQALNCVMQPLQSLVDELVIDHSTLAENKQIIVNVEYASDNLNCAYDMDYLYRALSNLLSNAIKYSPEGSEVNVLIKSEDNHINISVQDNGFGIPADDLPHIFERFYRVHTSDTALVEGTGLGLAITKTIIEQHGGSIAVESEAGKGTMFTVSIPE